MSPILPPSRRSTKLSKLIIGAAITISVCAAANMFCSASASPTAINEAHSMTIYEYGPAVELGHFTEVQPYRRTRDRKTEKLVRFDIHNAMLWSRADIQVSTVAELADFIERAKEIEHLPGDPVTSARLVHVLNANSWVRKNLPDNSWQVVIDGDICNTDSGKLEKCVDAALGFLRDVDTVPILGSR